MQLQTFPVLKPSGHGLWCRTLVPGLCIMSVLLTACSQGPKPPEVAGEAQSTKGTTVAVSPTIVLNALQIRTIKIQAGPIEQGTIPVRLTLTGTVQAIPNQTIRIGTPVAGKVEQVYVNLEDMVRPGETLVTLFSNEIGQVQSDLLNTLLDLEASRLQVETDLQLAKTTLERETRLYQEKVSAKADLEAARASMNKLTRQLASSKNKRTALIDVYDKRLQLMGASPGSARLVASSKKLQPQVNLKTLKSGIVTMRNANPGEWLDANTEILTIANLDHVWVVAQAFEKDLPALSVGQSVNVQLDSRPNQLIQGKIRAIGSEVHPETRTIDVRIEVSNEKHWLKPNLFARVNITVGERQGLIIPKLAVQTFGDRKVVYLQRSDNTFEQKRVYITSTDNTSGQVVVTGLQPGDRVVTQGAFLIHGEWVKKNY